MMDCDKTLDPVKQNKTRTDKWATDRNKFINGKNRNKELKYRCIYCLVIKSNNI